MAKLGTFIFLTVDCSNRSLLIFMFVVWCQYPVLLTSRGSFLHALFLRPSVSAFLQLVVHCSCNVVFSDPDSSTLLHLLQVVCLLLEGFSEMTCISRGHPALSLRSKTNINFLAYVCRGSQPYDCPLRPSLTRPLISSRCEGTECAFIYVPTH